MNWSGDKKNAAEQFRDIVSAINSVDNISNIRIDTNIYDYIYDVFDVYKDDEENVEFLKKLLETRIYITYIICSLIMPHLNAIIV